MVSFPFTNRPFDLVKMLVKCEYVWSFIAFVMGAGILLMEGPYNIFVDRAFRNSSDVSKWVGLVLIMSAYSTVVLSFIPYIVGIISDTTATAGKEIKVLVVVSATLLMGIQVVASIVFWLGRMSIETAAFLLGIVSVAVICFIDILLYFLMSADASSASRIRNTLFYLDVPILVGVVGVWYIHRCFLPILSHKEFSLGVLSGATAMQMIVGNISYGISGTFHKMRTYKPNRA